MHDQATPTPRHEPTDINTRPLAIAAVVCLLAAIAVPLGLYLLFKNYEKTATHPDENLVNFNSTAPQTPEPRVQGIPGFHDQVPRADMEQYRKESEQKLHSYGPAEEKGFVRIPIERAIELLSNPPTTQRSQ